MPEDRVDPVPADGDSRRPYNAPFLRRLDVIETESGKTNLYPNEYYSVAGTAS